MTVETCPRCGTTWSGTPGECAVCRRVPPEQGESGSCTCDTERKRNEEMWAEHPDAPAPESSCPVHGAGESGSWRCPDCGHEWPEWDGFMECPDECGSDPVPVAPEDPSGSCERCVPCQGRGERARSGLTVEVCPDCNGTGRPPESQGRRSE